MKRITSFPALGIGLFLAVLACGPRQPAMEAAEDAASDPDREAVAAPVEPMLDAAADAEASDDASPARARAELAGAPGSGVSGSVDVTDQAGGARIVVHVAGVKPAGTHGFHLHEVGDCSAPDFASAGEHFNPDGAAHACSPTTPRHRGDLGNIEIGENGEGHLELTTELLTAAGGASSVIGRAIVLHAGPDDCTTQPSGDSGARLACGTFELVNE